MNKINEEIKVDDGNNIDNDEFFTPSLFVDESYVLKNFTIDDFELSLFTLESSSTDFDLTGQLIWPGAKILSKFICENKNIFKNKSVIELGSGVGLSGLICANFCKKIILTDHNEIVLKIIKKNIHHYYETHPTFSGSLDCAIFEWGNQNHLNNIIISNDRFDIVIGADICYQQSNIPLLFNTIFQILTKNSSYNCIFYLGYIFRFENMTKLVFEEAEKKGLTVEEVSQTRTFIADSFLEGVIYEIVLNKNF